MLLGQHVVGVVLVLGDGCVLVEAVGFRLLVVGQLLDVVEVTIEVTVLRRVVQARGRELVSVA